MEIKLAFADKGLTAKGSKVGALGGEKRSPLNVPEMGATGRAISAAGRTATDINQRMYNAEGQREALQAAVDTAEGFNNIYDDIKNNTSFIEGKKLDPNYAGPNYREMSVDEHKNAFARRASELKASVLGKMKNVKAQQAFGPKFDAETSNEAIKAQDVGWNREVDRGLTTLYSALDKFSNEAARGDFKAIGDAEAAIKGAIDVGYITKEQGVKALDKFNNDTTMSYWKRQSDDFQEGTFDQVFVKSRTKKGFPVRGKKGLWNVKQKLPQSFKNLDEEQKRQTLEYIKKGWESYHSRLSWGKKKSKLVLNDDMKNDLAFIKATGKGDPQIEAKIRFAYGDDEDMMAQVLEIHDRNQTLAKVSNEWTDNIMKASPAEEAIITDNISRYTEGGGPVTKGYKIDPQSPEANRLINDPNVQKLSGWRRASFIAELETVRYKKQQALTKDPAAFVVKNYTEELSSIPAEARPAFMIAEQLRLGVPRQSVSLLTTVQAENIVSNLEGMTGEQKVAEVEQFQKTTTPEQFRILYRDLVKQDLPTGTMFLISQDHPSQIIVRQDYAKVLDMKEKDLKDALGARGSDVVKTFDNAYDAAIRDYSNSVANQGGGEMDTDRLNGIRTIVKKAVMNAARDSSVNVADTTKMYVDKSFNDIYNFQDGYRAPKEFNPDNISRYTDFLEKTLGDFNILAPGSANPALDADYVKRTYLDNIRTHGSWVNSPDGRGLNLLDSNNQLVLISRAPGELTPLTAPFTLADELGGEITAAINDTSIDVLDISSEGIKTELKRITTPMVDLVEDAMKASIKRDKSAAEMAEEEGLSEQEEFFLRGGHHRGLY